MKYIRLTPVICGSCSEFFLYSQVDREEQCADALTELVEFLAKNHAKAASIRLFTKKSLFEKIEALCARRNMDETCPLVWISQPDKATIPALSFQVHAIAGAQLSPIFLEDVKIGCHYQDRNAQYFLLNALANPALRASDAATFVFDSMQACLRSAGTDFSKCVRTWLFARDILSWYGQLNAARDSFLRKHDVFSKLVPASTGVGVSNPFGSALTAELLAVHPINGQVQIRKIASPLQCEALDYRSSFSRAVQIQSADYRRMFVSGTASISPDGKTAHLGNCTKQIALTMEVVERLIQNGGMGWADSVQAIAYFKNSADFGLFDTYCRSTGLQLPHIKIEADICRDDLLFELEINLLASSCP